MLLKQVTSSPFDAARSDDLDLAETVSSQKRSKVSSDSKAIKISKLIDFHREIQREKLASTSKADLDVEMQSSQPETKLFKTTKFSLAKIEGDRFIPLR